MGYDVLLLATGSKSNRFGWPGQDLRGVQGLYDLIVGPEGGEAVGEARGRDPNAPQYCDACFSGEYPVRPTDMLARGFEMQDAAE